MRTAAGKEQLPARKKDLPTIGASGVSGLFIGRGTERELTRYEYERLLLVMQTICSTGIRVSELSYITCEAAKKGRAEVTLKGKTRTVLLPKELTQKLLLWCRQRDIAAGPVFVTRGGQAHHGGV